MTRSNEKKLQEMLYIKTNEVISVLQNFKEANIDTDTCIKQITNQYEDSIFIYLFNQKNDEDNKNKN